MLIIMPANEFLEKAMLNSGYVCENHKVIIGKTNNLKKLVALFALILVYIFYLAWGSILTPITPDGDFAADMLLANRIADEGYLLVGHYSRWGFNHPGPFWFYYNEFMEIILKWIFPSRWVDWLVGGALINAFFIAFSTFSLSTYFLGRFNLTCTVLSAYLLLGFVGAEISIIWMPYRLITPYFAFLVCVLHILSGNFKYILASTFIVCILIHGYATMPFVTLPILGGGVLFGCLQNKKVGLVRETAPAILLASLVAFVFALPILVDSIVSKPSNLSSLFAANASLKLMPKPTWQDMSILISDVIFKENALSWLVSVLVLPIIILVAKPSEECRKKAVVAFGLLIATVLLVVIYYKNTPAPVHPFAVKFLISVPPLLFIFAFFVAFQSFSANGFANTFSFPKGMLVEAGLLGFVLILFAVSAKHAGKPVPNSSITDFADKIEASKPGKRVSIDYVEHEQWPFITGLLLELDRRGINACTTWSDMAIIYTKKHICDSKTLPDFAVISSKACSDTCLLISGEVGLKRSILELEYLKPEELVEFNHRGVLFTHWSTPEQAIRWSSGNEAAVIFNIKNREEFNGGLELHAGTLGGSGLVYS